MTATSAFGLGRRCWSSPQQCYLHCLRTYVRQIKLTQVSFWAHVKIAFRIGSLAGMDNYVGGSYGCAKFGANPSREGFWANEWNITKFLNTFFSWTHLLVRPVDEFSRLMAQATLTRSRVCLWGFVNTVPHFEGEIPENPYFGGVNRRFQAKRAKSWKCHVIEPTAWISTKFCTTIETTKWSLWVVPIGAQQIQDGGRPPFWKPLNRRISATVRPILMKFGTMTHIGNFQRTNH